MEVVFGMALDEEPLPGSLMYKPGCEVLGPWGLLDLLERQLGLPGAPKDNEILRVEQYRQVLQHMSRNGQEYFFEPSFEADEFAVATDLLSRRDELVVAGWSFQAEGGTPERLSCLAEAEALLRNWGTAFPPGEADRLAAILTALPARRLSLQSLHHAEPLPLLPPAWQRLLAALSAHGCEVVELPEQQPDDRTDLGRLQAALSGAGLGGGPCKGDGSLLVLSGQRDTDIAAWLAQLLQRNPHFRPAVLVPGGGQVLSHALALEGQPPIGVLSASLARPTLQVLKLAPVFLWAPIDPFKVMEFVSLAVKPLDRELGNLLAAALAERPGLFSDDWNRAVARFFAEVKISEDDPGPRYERADNQYRFWFRRPRYAIRGTAPKKDAIAIYNYLSAWARECFQEDNGRNRSLIVLSQQARRIKELLEALPENDLTYLQLERVVRTVYEPAPVQLGERAQGGLEFTTLPGAVVAPVSHLVWWNFAGAERDHFFSRWYVKERAWLSQQGVELAGPEVENALQVWHRKQPVRQAVRQLILAAPDFVNGQAVTPHPLMGDLEAALGSLSLVTYRVGETVLPPAWAKQFAAVPEYVRLPARPLGKPSPWIMLQGQAHHRIAEQVPISFSSLEELFYFPHTWAFKRLARLRRTSLLSIVGEKRLMGNLAHRLFELLLTQDGVLGWPAEQVDAFLDSTFPGLLDREGAVLLMYGQEPERLRLLSEVKRSAKNLLLHIRENGWSIVGTEQELEGTFLGKPFKGIADLVLKRGEELAVLDLKWSGKSYREQLLRNEEDLQLVLYAKMAGGGFAWAHTAYYIISRGIMLARNKLAFKDALATAEDADFVMVNQEVMKRMEATYNWRARQISAGKIEVRSAHTAEELEEAYEGGALLDLLEMKNEDAKFDEYQALIGLLE